MCRPIRDRRDPNKMVIHVTARAIEGLPFVPRLTINMAIKGILAKAQTLHPVTICAFLFMGNHHHFILAGDGNRISSFMEYIQGETSKTFKRFIPGKYKDKFWEGRFKEQRLGSPEAVIRKLIYIFSNPLTASLVNSVEDYPGVNSFKAFKNSQFSASYSELVPRLPVKLCKALSPEYSRKEDLQAAKNFIKQSIGYFPLVVTPFAWGECFREKIDEDEVRKRVLSSIAIHEEEIRKSKRGVLGKNRLLTQYLKKPFLPKKKTNTPFVDCPEIDIRKKLIRSYQSFRELCRITYLKIKKGIDAVWPQGAFVPTRLFRPLVAAPPVPIGG